GRAARARRGEEGTDAGPGRAARGGRPPPAGAGGGRRALAAPTFSSAPPTRHNVWIEGTQALAAAMPGLASTRLDARRFRIAGEIDDGELSRTRQAIAVDRNPAINRLAARIGEGEAIVQEIPPEVPPPAPAPLLPLDP